MIKLEIYENNKKLFFEIKDSGIGIKKEDLKKIFLPFEQIKHDNYNKNGTGLGLYMSQMIVEKQFGGEIRVDTSKNGTTFMVEIAKNIK